MMTRQEQELVRLIRYLPRANEFDVIVLIEISFRPVIKRFLEYLFFFALSFINPVRAEKMSIGLNQLKVLHWKRYLSSLNQNDSILNILRACESRCIAREATRWFLESGGVDITRNESLSRVYTGRKNAYYDRLYRSAKSALRSGFEESMGSGPRPRPSKHYERKRHLW